MEGSKISVEESERYCRQLLIFGEEGQNRLKNSHVAIAGAGGLGSPVAYYLAVAGVGSLTIIDKDVVELSNLNRQILHYDEDIGIEKVESASIKLKRINPHITVHAKSENIDPSSVDSLIGDASVIVDAMDNFETRYILNSFAVKNRKILVHGAVRSFDGQVTTVIPGKSACLACIFPDVKVSDKVPVIGITPGIIGLLQANEVIKHLLGIGEGLGNRLLLWDGLTGRLEEIKLKKRPDCPVCGNEYSMED